MLRADIPRNGVAKEPLSADAYAFFLNDAINFGPETQAFQNLNTWPEAFEPLAGRLVVIRDEASRKRTRASPGRVTWKSPRGWKPLKSVTNLPVMVQYRNRSDGVFRYRMYCLHRNGKRDETVVLLHVTHSEGRNMPTMLGFGAQTEVDHTPVARGHGVTAVEQRSGRTTRKNSSRRAKEPQGEEKGARDGWSPRGWKKEMEIAAQIAANMEVVSDDDRRQGGEGEMGMDMGSDSEYESSEEDSREGAPANGVRVSSLASTMSSPVQGADGMYAYPISYDASVYLDPSRSVLDRDMASLSMALSMGGMHHASAADVTDDDSSGDGGEYEDMKMSPTSARALGSPLFSFSGASSPNHHLYAEAPPSSDALHSFSLAHGVNPSLAIPDPDWTHYGQSASSPPPFCGRLDSPTESMDFIFAQ